MANYDNSRLDRLEGRVDAIEPTVAGFDGRIAAAEARAAAAEQAVADMSSAISLLQTKVENLEAEVLGEEPAIPLPPGPAGFTDFTLGPDAGVTYVSSSEGDDSNPGTIEAPLQHPDIGVV